ncbi:M3 family metallopeptidase [bacterium]|nr:M3 family metallopeptidase [bacterium]
MSEQNKNPLMTGERYSKFEAIPFDKFKTEHFMPAIDWALEIARKEFNDYIASPETPNFANTIEAESGVELDYVTGIYFNLLSCNADPEFSALAGEISQKLAEFGNETTMNPKMFEKLKYVFDHQIEENLNPEQTRLLEKVYKSFIRNGALLPEDKKKELMKINMEMSKLGPQFSQNVLNSTNKFEYIIEDEAELEGLPANAKAQAAYVAKQKGHAGKWLFLLQPSMFMPILQYAKNRELREKFSKAWGSRAFRDDFDNQEIVKQIAKLKYKRARLLGYETHSHFTLEERMAENPQTVQEFLDKILDVALPAAKKEIQELEEMAKADGIDQLMAWDVSYYAEILKKKKFDFDSEELRPYFKAENVIDGIFTVANKLYDLKFTEHNDLPKYHEDVRVFEVTQEEDGRYMGLLYIDLYPRDTKRAGAWMTGYRSQGFQEGEVKRPFISIVGSLTPPSEDKPSLLSLDEVTTIFHEFGHALHGLLSDVHYKTLASPNVYWDFVELPSQVMENWVLEMDTLKLFAHHYESGQLIPEELVNKVKKAETFNKGNFNVRQVSLGLIDMAWHATDPSTVEDVAKFEAEVTERTRLIPRVDGVNTSCSFSHIFHGGYSSGYYSYKWAEVLDADAFSKFKEDGIFNKETAKSFRENILAKGNSEHPMDLFIKFRGRKPDPDAMLRRDGLIK